MNGFTWAVRPPTQRSISFQTFRKSSIFFKFSIPFHFGHSAGRSTSCSLPLHFVSFSKAGSGILLIHFISFIHQRELPSFASFHSIHKSILPFHCFLPSFLFSPLVFFGRSHWRLAAAHNPPNQQGERKEEKNNFIPAHQTTPSIHQQANGELIGLLFCGLAGLLSALH